MYAHVPNVFGEDGRKLSKRHGAVSVDDFRDAGYVPDALVNFLALLGWSYDDQTTIMSRDELVERFSLERVGASPATFDYAEARLDERRLPAGAAPDAYADALVALPARAGLDWDEARVRAAAPLVQEKIAAARRVPRLRAASSSSDVSRTRAARRRPPGARGRRGARGSSPSRRRGSSARCGGSPSDWGSSRGRRSSRSASPSRARRSRRASSRASSCSAATSRCAARRGRRPATRGGCLQAAQRVERALELRARPGAGTAWTRPRGRLGR